MIRRPVPHFQLPTRPLGIVGLDDAAILAYVRKSCRERHYKGNSFITGLLKLLFQNDASDANIVAIGSGLLASVTPGSLYFSLHTADPGVAGSQTTNEAAYTSYVRQGLARNNTNYTVSSQNLQLAGTLGFPACTGSGETETHWGLGTASSGAGHLVYAGVLGSNIGAGTAVAATDIFTVPALGSLANGNQVSFYAPPGSTLPTGITQGTVYFVVSLSSDTFKVSATSGGSAIDITVDGEFLAFKHAPIVVTASPAVTPQLASGTIITEW